MASNRKKDLAKLVTKAMFGGALASWLTATIAGLLIQSFKNNNEDLLKKLTEIDKLIK